MKEIIDLRGASGTTYRFRIWPPGAAHLPTGGNYAFVKETPAGGYAVLAAAAVDDLSLIRVTHGAMAQEVGASDLFTRLNVSRAVRTAEAEDIAAFYQLAADPARRASGGGSPGGQGLTKAAPPTTKRDDPRHA